MMSGIIYFSKISFDMTSFKSHINHEKSSSYLMTIESQMSRRSLANIAGGGKVTEIMLNGKPVFPDYPYPKTRTSHKDSVLGDVYQFQLESGKNYLHIKTNNNQSDSALKIAQKYSFFDFFIGFISLFLPILLIIFSIASRSVECLLRINKKLVILDSLKGFLMGNITLLLLMIGVIIRLWYAWDMGYIQFQHDYQGHIEYIKFFANEFFVPLPHKAWEFPQQPLYYIFNGSLYALLAWFGVDEANILRAISMSTSVLSCIGLVYAYKLVKELSDKVLVNALTIGFLCFTPSFIYMSSRINNDPWAFSLSCIALFFIISSYKKQWKVGFTPALVFTSLLFLTKVSSLVVEVLFFILLISTYIHAPALVRKYLFRFYIVGLVILSYTLFRAYYPAVGIIELVNSGIWPGHDLRPLTLEYFLSFNFSSLLTNGQSHIDNYAITRSFPTYQYATMLFGEFDYSFWRDHKAWLFINMQILVVLALVVPLGWVAYLFRPKAFLDWVLIITSTLSIALLMKFFIQFPSVSNTDFRYHAAIFFFAAYFFAMGIDYIVSQFRFVKKFLLIWIALLHISSITFILTLISI